MTNHTNMNPYINSGYNNYKRYGIKNPPSLYTVYEGEAGMKMSPSNSGLANDKGFTTPNDYIGGTVGYVFGYKDAGGLFAVLKGNVGTSLPFDVTYSAGVAAGAYLKTGDWTFKGETALEISGATDLPGLARGYIEPDLLKAGYKITGEIGKTFDAPGRDDYRVTIGGGYEENLYRDLPMMSGSDINKDLPKNGIPVYAEFSVEDHTIQGAGYQFIRVETDVLNRNGATISVGFRGTNFNKIGSFKRLKDNLNKFIDAPIEYEGYHEASMSIRSIESGDNKIEHILCPAVTPFAGSIKKGNLSVSAELDILGYAMESYNKFQDNPTIYEIKGGSNFSKEAVSFFTPKNAELRIEHKKELPFNLNLNTQYAANKFTGIPKRSKSASSGNDMKTSEPLMPDNNNPQNINKDVSIMHAGNQRGFTTGLEWNSPDQEWGIKGTIGTFKTKVEVIEYNNKSGNAKINTNEYRENPVGLEIERNFYNRNYNLAISAGVTTNLHDVNLENIVDKTSVTFGIKLSPVNGHNSPHRKVTKPYGRRH